MRKKKDKVKYPKGTGFAVGLLFGVSLALATGNNALFVIGIAIGAALETTYVR